ncbi:MAG: YHS domain-containing protein, partial [Henriciella sp.]|nr:YHS domain-containing protein [Henriciella sp.]
MDQIVGKDASERSSDHAVDPVCGMSVTISPDARRADYDGEIFYFCSDKCHTKFKADPVYYAPGKASDRRMTSQAGAQYTCPMHPD